MSVSAAACRLEPCLTPRRVRAGHRAPGQLCRAPHDRRTAADAADRPVGARPPLMSQSQSLRSRVSESVRRPEFINDLLQILKGVVAATAAWWFALNILESELPFLAPWTALLTVHATVYRSLSTGIQTTAASGIGVLLSFLVGNYLGVSLWTFALALLVGMTASRLTWIRDEGVAIATTAIFVLGSGFENQEHLLTDRVVEVLVGVGFGLAVNLMIIPPLRDRQAARHIDSINRRDRKSVV